MLEKSHLKFIYSTPLYSVAEKQASAVVKEPVAEAKTQPEPKTTTESKPITTEPETEVVRKHVLVLYTGKELAPEESGLLIKILQAVNVKLEDTALVNTATLKDASTYTDLIKQYDYSKLISFGTSTDTLGLALSKNTIKSVESRKYLLTDSFPELLKDVAKKKVLWAMLKEMFAL